MDVKDQDKLETLKAELNVAMAGTCIEELGARQASGACAGAMGTNAAQCSGEPYPLQNQGLYPKHISGNSYLTQQLMLQWPDSQLLLSSIGGYNRRSCGIRSNAETVSKL